jgi:hypothetical protein
MMDGWDYSGASEGAQKGQYFLVGGIVQSVVGMEQAEAVVEAFEPSGKCKKRTN